MFVPLAGSGDSILSTQVRPTFRAFAPVTRDRSVCGLHGQSAVAPSIWLARARLWSEVYSTLVHCRCTRTCQNHLREMRPPDSYPPPLVLLYFHMETSRGRWWLAPPHRGPVRRPKDMGCPRNRHAKQIHALLQPEDAPHPAGIHDGIYTRHVYTGWSSFPVRYESGGRRENQGACGRLFVR